MSVKVSIVVPVYNQEQWIDRCLDSLTAQTLKDIEIICVDDGSEDASAKIISARAAADSRIKLICQARSNAGKARNTGIKAAGGEFLFFFDPDDCCKADMLEKMVACAEQEEADMVVAEHFNCNVSGNCSRSRLPKYPVASAEEYTRQGKNVFRSFTTLVWKKLFRTSFIEEKQLLFQEITRTNDMYFSYMAVVLAKRIAVINEAFYYYQVGVPGSLQSTNDASPFCFYEALSAVKSDLEKLGMEEFYRKSLAQAAFFSCVHNLMNLKQKSSFNILFKKVKDEIFPAMNVDVLRVSDFRKFQDMMLFQALTKTNSAFVFRTAVTVLKAVIPAGSRRRALARKVLGLVKRK